MMDRTFMQEHSRAVGAIAGTFNIPKPSKGGPRLFPFITIARQPGAGAGRIGRRLVELLNQSSPAATPWLYWDRELVEKVATDFHLPEHVVSGLDNTQHYWLLDFLQTIGGAQNSAEPSEIAVFSRVAQTIRTLASAGRAVIVGRGGAILTRGMPGGIHVYLVASRKYRVNRIAELLNMSTENAAKWVLEQERCRADFYRRHWPDEVVGPEMFGITLNTEAVPAEMAAQLLHRAMLEQLSAMRTQREEALVKV